MSIYFRKSIILFFLFLYSFPISAKSGVTYTFSGGRLGDCLLSYCHALWAAHVFDLDLIYKPFKYSDQLMLHTTDILYSEEIVKHYKQVLHINYALQYGVQPDTLYVVPFFCESHIEKNDPMFPFLFQVDWKDLGYKQALKKRICPRFGLRQLILPTDGITIALHVRKGTGWDIPRFAPNFEKLMEIHPLRWLPDSYYIEQIKKIAETYSTEKLYIYLFTDHDKPLEIIENYRKIINNQRIIWKCREQDNRHDLNVLEDFFALTQFDCFIRNDSNFAVMASKLGNYKLMIGPWNSRKIGDTYVVDEIIVEYNT